MIFRKALLSVPILANVHGSFAGSQLETISKYLSGSMWMRKSGSQDTLRHHQALFQRDRNTLSIQFDKHGVTFVCALMDFTHSPF